MFAAVGCTLVLHTLTQPGHLRNQFFVGRPRNIFWQPVRGSKPRIPSRVRDRTVIICWAVCTSLLSLGWQLR